MSWNIGTLANCIGIEAAPQDFVLNPLGPWDLSNSEAWPSGALGSTLGMRVRLEVESLLERGLAVSTEGRIEIPWSRWDDLVKLGLELPRHWMPWSPFLLQIDSFSELGREDFEYRYRFLLGTREVLLHRMGAIVQRQHHLGFYVLDPQTYSLVEAMEAFNSQSPVERKDPAAWLRFGEVKGCAQAIGAQLDDYLGTNDVVIPSKIGLTVVEKADGSMHFLPRCQGLPRGVHRGTPETGDHGGHAGMVAYRSDPRLTVTTSKQGAAAGCAQLPFSWKESKSPDCGHR